MKDIGLCKIRIQFKIVLYSKLSSSVNFLINFNTFYKTTLSNNSIKTKGLSFKGYFVINYVTVLNEK